MICDNRMQLGLETTVIVEEEGQKKVSPEKTILSGDTILFGVSKRLLNQVE